MTLVRMTDGEWQEWHDDVVVEQTVATCTVVRTYHDGRSETEEAACDPYTISTALNGDQVAQLLADGVWTKADVEAVGARVPVAFVAPKGKQTVGPPRYEAGTKGTVRQVFDVEDIPAPPTTEEKVSRVLAAFGLTKEELMAAVAEPAEAKG